MRIEYLYIFLTLAGIAALGIAWNYVLNLLCFKLSSWPGLAARYPRQHFGPVQESYRRQTGAVGKIRMRRGFQIQVAPEGLIVTPSFAKKLPLYVPWSCLTIEENIPFSVLVKLESLDQAYFYLPRTALPAVKPRLQQSKTPSLAC